MLKIMYYFWCHLPYYLLTLVIFILDIYIFEDTSVVLGFHMTLKMVLKDIYSSLYAPFTPSFPPCPL